MLLLDGAIGREMAGSGHPEFQKSDVFNVIIITHGQLINLKFKPFLRHMTFLIFW